MARRGTIASHVPRDAIESDARRALEALGYQIVQADEPRDAAHQAIRAGLRIVDEGDLDQIAGGEAEPVPIVVLTGMPAPPPESEPAMVRALGGMPDAIERAYRSRGQPADIDAPARRRLSQMPARTTSTPRLIT